MPPSFGGTRTMLGPQVNSRRTSAPNYGFGTCTRETQDKVFVSQEHAALAASSSCSPGPVYDQRPAIGPQVNGAMTSAPRYGFGTSDREDAAKVYISAEHEKFSGGGTAPGPGTYPVKSLTGVLSMDSAKTNLPRYGFGSSTRDHQAKVFVSAESSKTADYGKASPGPYLNPGVGTKVLSSGPSPYASGGSDRLRNASQPSWILGKAERFEKDGSAWVPGPGAYAITPSVGAQVSSKKPSLPRFGFGTSNRDDAAKVYISAEHDALSGGRDAPGPGTYPIRSLTGKPIVAGKQVSGSSWGFGKSKRFVDEFKHQLGNPGPGQYLI